MATPAGVDLADVAALAGLEHRTADAPGQVARDGGGTGLVEVRTDRAENVRLHRQTAERVAAAIGDGRVAS